MITLSGYLYKIPVVGVYTGVLYQQKWITGKNLDLDISDFDNLFFT